MFLLHQEANRAETYKHLPVRMPEGVDFVPVVDPALISEVLASPIFEVEDGAGEYRRMGERTRFDFSHAVTAFKHIPLANEGDAHRKLRDEMASIIAARAKQVEPGLRSELTRQLPPLLAEGRTLDLMDDVAVPTYASLFSVLLGVDAAIVRGGHVSEIFDRLLSLNRRKRLERSLQTTLEKLRSAGLPEDLKPEMALAMTILGREALVGSLGVSLWLACSRYTGKPLEAIDFGQSFGATGVPIVDRLAARDTAIGDVTIPKGTRVRLFLDATSCENAPGDAGLLFGKGRHLCLGKPLALIAWRVVTRILKASPLRVRPASFAFRTGDFLFNYPERAHVELFR